MTPEELIAFTAEKILSGGNRTTAENLRDVLAEFATSMRNTDEDLVLGDKPIIMKSAGPEGHYFKYRPDDSGNLVPIDDLGPTYP